MKKNVAKRVLLGLLAVMMCFGLFACTKNLTSKEIKEKLEKKDYSVVETTIAGTSGIVGTNGSETITIFVCENEEAATKVKKTLETFDITDKIVYKQDKQYIYTGTEAGVKTFEKII